MGRESDFFQRWAGFQARLLNSSQVAGNMSAYNRSLPLLIQTFASMLILIFGGLEVMKGTLSVGVLITFLAFFQFYFQPLQKLADSINQLQLLGAFIESMNDILNYPSKAKLNESIELNKSKLNGSIQIENIFFGYNANQPPTIVDFSINIHEGQSVAIVGSSGCGKTTLLKLLTGLYEPWSGVIMMDGIEINKIPRGILTSSVGVIDQEIELFKGTLKDVISFWDPSISIDEIIEVCKLAAIHEVISSRPLGYESLVDEEGRNFSGGQRQRLEIARALLKKPSVLIMDEATSALDPETEKEIMDNIRALGITTIIVAHRLSTIRDCNQILVLDKGQIIESGTHFSLLQDDGQYSELLKQLH